MSTFPKHLTLHSSFKLRDDVSTIPLNKYNYLLYVTRSACDWEPTRFGRWSLIVYRLERARLVIKLDNPLFLKETTWKSELRATVPLYGSSIYEAAFYCAGSKYEDTYWEIFKITAWISYEFVMTLYPSTAILYTNRSVEDFCVEIIATDGICDNFRLKFQRALK